MKNTLILALAKIFEKGIMFLFFIILAHKFGTEAFGEFSYYFTIASLLFVLFDVGGEFYQIREFTKNESIKIFQNIFILKTVVAMIVFFIALYTHQNLYLLLLIGSFYLDSVISIFKSSLYKNGQYYQESVIAIIEKSIFILLVILNIFTVNNIILIYLTFIIAKLVYLLIALNKFYSFKYFTSTFRIFDLSYSRSYTFNSWSYILHALLVVIFVQIDIVMLKEMGISFTEIGLYSAAVKIYFTVIVFAEILFKQYYPKISIYLHLEDDKSLKKLILRVQSLNINISVVLAFLTMMFANEIIMISFGTEFLDSSKMLILLSVIILFRFSMYTYTALLSASNFNYIKVITSLLCVIVNISMNYLLIPIYGVYGAIFATIITELLLVVMFKIGSFKIIFTNYIKINEFSSLLFIIFSSYFFMYHNINIYYKIILVLFLMLTLFIYKDKITKVLDFN